MARSILYGPPGQRQDDARPDRRRDDGCSVRAALGRGRTVAEVRAVIAAARDRLGGNGGRTILFLDEIHRFNKAQQDALLPSVEEGS